MIVEILDAAERDLEDIADYIARVLRDNQDEDAATIRMRELCRA